MYSCLKPKFTHELTRIDATRTSITIIWLEPQNNGCPLTGFSIFRNNGVGDPTSIEVDPTQVNSKPSLRQYTISGLT